MERLISLDNGFELHSFSLEGSSVRFEALVKSSENFCKNLKNESWLTNVRFDNVRITSSGDEISCSFGVSDEL